MTVRRIHPARRLSAPEALYRASGLHHLHHLHHLYHSAL